MKLAIRILALSFVVAAAAAATVSSSTTHAVVNHQAATAAFPTPTCGAHVPGCPTPTR